MEGRSSGRGFLSRTDVDASPAVALPRRGLMREQAGRASTPPGRRSHRNDDSLMLSPLSAAVSNKRTTAHSQRKTSKDPIYDQIPPDYQYNPKTASPQLHFLPKAAAAAAQKQQSSPTAKQQTPGPSLRRLIAAAEDDVRLHRARKQAGLTQNRKLLRTYQLQTDPAFLARQKRATEWQELVKTLQEDAAGILYELEEDPRGKTGLTASERTQVQLARWQRALELYVYGRKGTDHDLDLLGLLETLLDGINEDDEMSETLKQASDMCSSLVDATQQYQKDSSDSVLELEEAYLIRLQAHELFLRNGLEMTDDIQNQFRLNGRAALQIGHQLEFLESKRRQCEAASILIRRWWLMESLAEQEAASPEPIKVSEEVRGAIPLANCRMDPLFVRPEQSLEASQALKQLRAVVRSKGSTAAAAQETTNASTRRFDMTANLILRTSDAMEQRLLTSFLEVYSQGGTYDFSGNARPGVVDWRELRALAQALLLFDSGKRLHKRYVEMVISSRFPELGETPSEPKKKKPKEPQYNEDGELIQPSADEEDEDLEEEFDMDATRSTLTNLFHRVSEVCTAEFELISHVFGTETIVGLTSNEQDITVVVIKALLQRVISDPALGLQARINDLLESIDRRGDFDAGSRKLDTFVVIHEKAAGLFSLLKDAAERTIRFRVRMAERFSAANNEAVESITSFLTSQEIALNNSHGQGYLNLELRLLHHECCLCLDQVGCVLLKPSPKPLDPTLAEKGILEEYTAPLLLLDQISLIKKGFNEMLAGPLKSSVLRTPLLHATDSLARARLMFGSGKKGGDTTARVITSIYSQMCGFYGEAYLYQVVEALGAMLPTRPPSTPPALPFDEDQPAHSLGVDPAFWVGFERVHSAAKSFDRELWAENRLGSNRVWETLNNSGAVSFMTVSRGCRVDFFSGLERRGEAAILKALDTLGAHIQWVLVSGESLSGARIVRSLTGPGNAGGPYAIPAGSSLDSPNSAAVKSLTYCLRVQFVHVQAALTSTSLSAFWTALSMRLYDIFVARLLQHYYVSTVGAIILSRDAEALRSVAMLAGSEHGHWDTLRELITLYMTPPDALKTMLVGQDGGDSAGSSSKGLFHHAGRDQSIVFMSRRIDYRYKTAQGLKKSGWALQLLEDLGVQDPTDSKVNIGLFAAERKIL